MVSLLLIGAGAKKKHQDCITTTTSIHILIRCQLTQSGHDEDVNRMMLPSLGSDDGGGSIEL